VGTSQLREIVSRHELLRDSLLSHIRSIVDDLWQVENDLTIMDRVPTNQAT